MSQLQGDNKRIVKNTAFMYIRMFFTMLVGLYTSRVVLDSLGFDDYGLYNVVGGIIAMFSFLNGALSQTTSRYITFYLGKSDLSKLQDVFSTSFFIHLILALIIIALGETVGLWYANNKLVVPEGRFDAAMWLYQFTVITAAINIISVPFNASIISYEKLSVYAVFAITESVFKLVVAISIAHVSFDKLIYYGAMLLAIQVLYNFCAWVYSSVKFEGARIRKVFDKQLFKEIFGFTGWNLFGNFSYTFFTQGINLMLNFFCGTTVNAARGIAVQVEGVVRQFATNVQTAINPQIIKSYAKNQIDRFFTLIFASSRYCFYLLLLLILPIILEADFILTLWLGAFPEHTVSFLRITLLMVLLESLVTPMYMANLASGKVKIYQITMCIIAAVFIPISYFAIKLTSIPEVLFLTTMVMTIVEIIARFFIVHAQVGLPRKFYLKKVVLNILIVGALSSILPSILHAKMCGGVARFFVVGAASVVSVGLTVYCIGIDQEERLALHTMVVSFVKRRRQTNR